jgi:hypothetical protein
MSSTTQLPTSDYRPGACNIGPDEIRRRRLFGHLGAAATVGLLVVLVAAGAPPLARLLVALPAAGAAIGYLQAHLRFCIAFGLAGVFNFGALGGRHAVADATSRARDRRRALYLLAAAALIGLAAGLLALLPV